MGTGSDDEQMGVSAVGHGKQPTEHRAEGRSTPAEAGVKAKPPRRQRGKAKPKKVDLAPLLLERVRVRKGGQDSRMPVFEATIHKQVEQAIKKRKVAAMTEIIKLAIENDLVVSPPPAPNSGGVFILPRMTDEDVEKMMNFRFLPPGEFEAILRKYK